MHSLLRNVEFVKMSSALVASSTDEYFTAVDMSGFEGITAFINLGAVTTAATLNFHLEMCSSSGFSTGSDITDIANSAAYMTSTQGSDDMWLATECYRPTKQWVRAVSDKAAANTVTNSVLYARWRASDLPVDESTTFTDYTYVANGTSGSATG